MSMDRVENRTSVLERVKKISEIETLERVNDLLMTGRFALLAVLLKWGGNGEEPSVRIYVVAELRATS